LQKQGAEAIILGCTEIPLAIDNKVRSNLIFIDPTNILARSLIRESYPNKLK
jgi:aspartate racemase